MAVLMFMLFIVLMLFAMFVVVFFIVLMLLTMFVFVVFSGLMRMFFFYHYDFSFLFCFWPNHKIELHASTVACVCIQVKALCSVGIF